MWDTFTQSAQVNANLNSSRLELLRATLRNLIVATAGIYILAHFVAGLALAESLDWRIWLVTFGIVITVWLAFSLFAHHLLAAQVVWIVGLALCNTLALVIFQRPEIAFFYALLPLMVVVLAGWPAALATVALMAGLLWWLSHSALVALPSPYYPWVILTSGLITGVIGWAAGNASQTLTHWLVFGFEQTRQTMEEMRQHRAQLSAALKDLDQAYYRLERTNAALATAWHAAEKAERFKAEFVAYVSHEMRTPLNLIAGFSETMLAAQDSYGAPLPGPYRRDLNTIAYNAQHLLALVDDILDLARLEAGKITLTREATHPAALVEEVAGMVRDYVTAKGLELRLQLTSGLPAVWIDRQRIRQVLLNLLVNAARFTERGWIEVRARAEGDELIFQVADTGRGIAPHDLSRIFDEFHSSEQPPLADWHSGAGLGLPISKKFVELHRGRMGVESALLQGTTFWFTLPSGPAAEAEPAPAAIAHRAEAAPAARRSLVVVHDDHSVHAWLERHLGEYQLLRAGGLAEGLARAEEEQALAVVADSRYGPPASPPPVPFIQCTLPSHTRWARALGAAEFLLKPVPAKTLLDAVARVGPVQRVLIVDDEPEMVALFRRVLNPRILPGNCLGAYDGLSALEMMRAHRPELVLLDLSLPGKNGREVLQDMRREPALAGIPVIIVSGAPPDDEPAAPQAPFYISRAAGFQPAEIARLLEAAFSALATGWRPAGSTAAAPATAIAE